MHADTAMYKAKEQGGSSYQAYSRAMNASALQRLTLENALRRALERDGVRAALPADRGRPAPGVPIGRRGARPLAASGAGPAAPVRVHSAGGGERPDRAARRMGAARGLRAESGVAGRPASRRSGSWSTCPAASSGARLPETVGRILQSTGLEPRYLGLELTESLLVKHHKEDTDTLHALRGHGPAPGGGRLRHRLLVVQLPEAPAAGRAQDRPLVRPRDHDVAGRRGDHDRDHRDGARARAQGGRRGRRDRRSSATCCGRRGATRCRATCSAGRCLPDALCRCCRREAAAARPARRLRTA